MEIEAKRIVELEMQCEKLNVEKFKLKEEMLEVEGNREKMRKKYVKVKDKCVKVNMRRALEGSKWKEEVENIKEKFRQVVVEKRKLELDLKEAEQRIIHSSAEEAEKLMEKVENLESLLEESDNTITMLLGRNEALERDNSRLEMDFVAKMGMVAEKQKVKEEKILELVQKIDVLKREKAEMEAEFRIMKEDNNHEAERNFNVKKDYESEKKKAMEMISELVKRVASLESVKEVEKRAMEDEGKKKISELTCRIEFLEREKMELETEVCQEKRERSEEINKILKEKTFLKEIHEKEKTFLEDEGKKKVSELTRRIEFLEREKMGLETEVCRGKRAMSEEIKKISKEKASLKEIHEKEMLDLVSKSGILEREKQELEAETRVKDERIKLLVQEKEHSTAKKKMMEIMTNLHVVNLEQDVELPQQVHPARNVGRLSSLTAQNPVNKEDLGMVEQGKFTGVMQPAPAPSSSSASVNLHYNPYPPLAKYEDVAANPKLFLDTLQKLHTAMGTKFMIPIMGCRDLDLHKLFVEVTTRGGVDKILREKKWKEVTAVFNFPSTATNASFILRKHYFSLLHHYEQIYFFKARGWTPMPYGSWQSGCALPIVPTTSLYQTVPGMPTTSPIHQVPQPQGTVTHPSQSNTIATSVITPPVTRRRKRRKKSEIKRRDPAHPRPIRSGYNFFFAEQHARLKPLYRRGDREIMRSIGELWTNLKEHDKTVYQEKVVNDKERYRREMESYIERLTTGQAISDVVPIQQRLPILDAEMMDVEVKDVARKDYSETFEDEEDEEDEECSMSGSEYEDDADYVPWS